MDLYRAVRIATYLVVLTGALAVWMVENHLGYLSLVAGAAVLDYTFCEAGRRPPIRRWLADLLTLAILLAYAFYLALPAYLDGKPWVAVSEVAHFLIVLQAVTFFTPQRGSIIRTYCCPTLAVLVVTAVVFSDGHGPGLLLRLALYVAATAWLLFLHALWRERQRFADQEEALELVSGAKPNAQRPSARQHLGERTARQGLAMTAVMTVLCLVTGFLLFFSWPRLSETTKRFFEQLFPSTARSDQEPGTGMDGPNVLPVGGGVIDTVSKLSTGFSMDLRLDQLAPLYEDPTPALQVYFPELPRDALDDDGMLYLRGGSLVTYRDNGFVPPNGKTLRDLDAEAGSDYVALEETSGHHLRPTQETRLVEQRMHLLGQRLGCYLALAPVRRVKGVRVRLDEEGGLHPDGSGVLRSDDESGDYVVWSNPVPRPDPNARAHSKDSRYLNWQDSVTDRPIRLKLRELALSIVKDQPNDLAKALAIRDHLRDSGKYRYSAALNELDHKSDSVAEFLFGTPTQRQGTCGHFATAFVMLCRAAELPARVALGFARPVENVPPGGVRDRKVTFLQLHGHAWAEVHFQGYGWVPFDATTAFSGTQISDRNRTADLDDKDWKPALDTDQFPEQKKSLVGEGWEYFLGYDGDSQDRLYSTMGSSVRDFFDKLGNLLSGAGDLGLSGVVLAWMIGAGLLGLLVWTVMRSHEDRSERARHLTPRARAAVAFYNDLLSVLSKRGFVRRNGQTPEEFAEAVVRRGGEAFEPVRMVTRTFERVRYGGEDVPGEELDSLRAALETLREPPEGGVPGGATPARL